MKSWKINFSKLGTLSKTGATTTRTVSTKGGGRKRSTRHSYKVSTSTSKTGLRSQVSSRPGAPCRPGPTARNTSTRSKRGSLSLCNPTKACTITTCLRRHRCSTSLRHHLSCIVVSRPSHLLLRRLLPRLPRRLRDPGWKIHMWTRKNCFFYKTSSPSLRTVTVARLNSISWKTSTSLSCR